MKAYVEIVLPDTTCTRNNQERIARHIKEDLTHRVSNIWFIDEAEAELFKNILNESK